ncbi:hypothetical protein [Flavobacterium sp.]|uniref:hypothetical protein n=1 Tax=Flavobacterium sp. TaxID=239 RepID=UPI001B4EB93B|nr:hypothetical protein [Flavobacterium sp.]MBP6127332.1 hypothetical protein [Flavobacterium sp.]
MQNYYFGKLDNSFIFYIDPIHFDIINFSKKISTVYCNEINFVNCQDEIQNAQLDLHTFIEKLKNKTISEFDLIFDDEIHIQNIWWDDLLVISNLDNLEIVLTEIKQTISADAVSKLDISINSPNYYFSFNKIISKQEVSPISFQDFIKDSVHYQDKEQKFI